MKTFILALLFVVVSSEWAVSDAIKAYYNYKNQIITNDSLDKLYDSSQVLITDIIIRMNNKEIHLDTVDNKTKEFDIINDSILTDDWKKFSSIQKNTKKLTKKIS